MGTAALKTEMNRLRALASCKALDQLPAVEPAGPSGDAGELAAEIAASFRQKVQFYREVFKQSVQEAVAHAEERHLESEERLLKSPPNELAWHDLRVLSDRDPDLALRRWEEVKQAARDERRSGHRGARVAGRDSCWERAQYIALHGELTEAWRPRDGQELLLIDQMAQFQTLMEDWQETLTAYTNIWSGTLRGGKVRGRRRDEDEPPELPRVFIAEAVDQAASMVERMHRLYLQTLKALQDRRRGAAVVVRRAGQVNVGAQQVNGCGRN